MKKTIVLIISFLAISCSRSYEVFSNKYLVSFSCDISQAPFNKVQTSGYFLSVRPTAQMDGYKVKEPDGREQTTPFTEFQNRVFNFGLSGLIIGKPYFGDDAYYAYDLGCPQCDRKYIYLKVSIEGIAICPKCNNTYDLNNQGVPLTGDSRPLYRYRTTLNGKMLIINN